MQEMPLATWGHAGRPLLMLPTAAADYLEYERFMMIEYMTGWIDAGRVRVYSVNSVNDRSLLNRNTPPDVKIELIKRYNAYLTQEVLPLIRQDTGDPNARPLVMGISLGAYLAANLSFGHPDLFGGGLFYGGTYDIKSYLNGFYNEDVYFNNPIDFLPNLNDPYHLSYLRNSQIILYTGQGAYEDPDRTRKLSNILNSKGIDHWLDIWGYDVDHDWPWWRKAIVHHFNTLFGGL
jgi:esterase/lipase superfamily enzyme